MVSVRVSHPLPKPQAEYKSDAFKGATKLSLEDPHLTWNEHLSQMERRDVASSVHTPDLTLILCCRELYYWLPCVSSVIYYICSRILTPILWCVSTL